MTPHRRAHLRITRSAVTLIELLVVVTIVVLLVAVSVPLMKPALKDGQLREASRQINTLFAVAKGKALIHERGAGVMIQRSEAGSNAAFELFLAETPPPYAGDFVGAKCTLLDLLPSGAPDGNAETAVFGLSNSAPGESATLPFLVFAGDRIQFNYQGPQYEIVTVTTYQANPMAPVYPSVVFQSPAATPTSWPDQAGAVPFQITRQPRKTSGTPLQLAGGVVVDLQYSGMGASGQQFNGGLTGTSSPVVIMFDANGAISRVFGSAVLDTTQSPPAWVVPPSGVPPSGTIHLLIGRFEQTVSATADQTNLADLRNSWVSISERTGTLTTAENVIATTIADSRELARSGQSMGGR